MQCFHLLQGKAGSLFQDFHISLRSVYPNPLSIFNQPGRIFYAHDCGKTVLPGDNGTMGHHPAYFRHQAFNRYEQGRPAGVGKGCYQYVVSFIRISGTFMPDNLARLA